MKKVVRTFVLLLLSVGMLAGCSLVSGTMEKVDDLTSKDEDIYEKLSSGIISPTNLTTDDRIAKKMTFTAAIGESFKMESDDEEINDKMFLTVFISRQPDKPILVQVDKLKDYPKEGYVKITGKAVGSIYYNTNSGQEDYLHVQASKIEAFEPKEKKSPKSGSYVNKDGVKYTFKEAKLVQDDDQKKVVVIYEIDSKKVDDTVKILSRINGEKVILYQGDDYLEEVDRTVNIEDFNGASDILNQISTIEPGTAATTFIAYEAVNEEKEIYVCDYNDDFELIYEEKITVE